MVSLLRSRTSLVTVRLSFDEHERLKSLCESAGARSISDFVRETILQRMSATPGSTGLLTRDLFNLTANLQALRALLNELSDRILDLLGGPARAEEMSPHEQAEVIRNGNS